VSTDEHVEAFLAGHLPQPLLAATLTSEGSGTSGTTEPIECGRDPMPPGGDCPEQCINDCADDVCLIECSGAKTCIGETFACPDNYACTVACMGLDTCAGGTVQCPTGYACAVECSGEGSCADLTIDCGNASCSLTCNFVDPCPGATLQCGSGACSATCTGNTPPTVDCGNACECNDCRP
jgi:hypothetical protein